MDALIAFEAFSTLQMPTTSNVQRIFDTAAGWLELGNVNEAGKELQGLPPADFDSPEVLQLRCRIYRFLHEWKEEAEVAERAARMYPDRPFFQASLPWALRQLGRTQEGLEIAQRANRPFRLARGSLACLGDYIVRWVAT